MREGYRENEAAFTEKCIKRSKPEIVPSKESLMVSKGQVTVANLSLIYPIDIDEVVLLLPAIDYFIMVGNGCNWNA